MQKDDWREERRDRPEGLVLQYGTCRFCGQVRQIETAAGWDQEQVDEAASTSCSCPGAEDYRHEKKDKGKRPRGSGPAILCDPGGSKRDHP